MMTRKRTVKSPRRRALDSGHQQARGSPPLGHAPITAACVLGGGGQGREAAKRTLDQWGTGRTLRCEWGLRPPTESAKGVVSQRNLAGRRQLEPMTTPRTAKDSSAVPLRSQLCRQLAQKRKRRVAEMIFIVQGPRAWLLQPQVDDESYACELLFRTWTCDPRSATPIGPGWFDQHQVPRGQDRP